MADKASFCQTSSLIRKKAQDFPGGSVVKTLSSNAGGTCSILGWEIRSHVLNGQEKKFFNDKREGKIPSSERKERWLISQP